MMKAIMKKSQSVFEKIKKVDQNGNEYWSARDLAIALDYKNFRNFVQVIEKAAESCKTSGNQPLDHFVEADEMINLPKGAKRQVLSYHLSRYACYLIVQNADPAKEPVAIGQTYFAIQTRLQELTQLEAYNSLNSENEKRLFLREEMKRHNLQLADAAKDAGVIEPLDYAIFQDHGYKGLYGGMTAKDIHSHKELKKSQKILDHMGSTELAANLFRATQTEEKLRRENIRGKEKANHTHLEVGKKVRKTIADLGGTMPEDLPVAESIKKLEHKERKQIEAKGKK